MNQEASRPGSGTTVSGCGVGTAVSLIGFGITINRFSLYLIQSSYGPRQPRPFLALFQAEQVGFGMVVFGMALLVWATARYSCVSHEIERGTYVPRRTMMWVITAVVLLFGLPVLVWLFQR